MTAARALLPRHHEYLPRHHEYLKIELMEYLRRCYPEIPYEYRRPLILDALAGAQKAAR